MGQGKIMSNSKVAVVTGAAKGIGVGIAESLGKAGYQIVLISRGNDVHSQAECMANKGYKSASYVCDITKKEKVQDIIQKIINIYHRIDVLVNNAGISGISSFEKLDEEMIDRQINTNLKGTIYVTQAVLPYMKKKMWGRIINMSSVTGAYVCDAGYSSYAMTKAGIIGLTKALAVEYAQYSITCNAVCPGFVKTPAVMRTSAITNPDNPEAVIQKIASNVPLGRLGTPEEIGALVTFLASEEAGYITGTANIIDGGSMLPETSVKRLS